MKSGFGVKRERERERKRERESEREREMEVKNNGENCIVRNFMLASPNQTIRNVWSM